MLSCALAWAGDGFISLVPKHNIAECWIVDGKAPAEAWTLHDGVIPCTGQPSGFLRNKRHKPAPGCRIPTLDEVLALAAILREVKRVEPKLRLAAICTLLLDRQ